MSGQRAVGEFMSVASERVCVSVQSLCDYQAIVSSIGVSVNVCVIVKSLCEFLVFV